MLSLLPCHLASLLVCGHLTYLPAYLPKLSADALGNMYGLFPQHLRPDVGTCKLLWLLYDRELKKKSPNLAEMWHN